MGHGPSRGLSVRATRRVVGRCAAPRLVRHLGRRGGRARCFRPTECLRIYLPRREPRGHRRRDHARSRLTGDGCRFAGRARSRAGARCHRLIQPSGAVGLERPSRRPALHAPASGSELLARRARRCPDLPRLRAVFDRRLPAGQPSASTAAIADRRPRAAHPGVGIRGGRRRAAQLGLCRRRRNAAGRSTGIGLAGICRLLRAG